MRAVGRGRHGIDQRRNGDDRDSGGSEQATAHEMAPEIVSDNTINEPSPVATLSVGGLRAIHRVHHEMCRSLEIVPELRLVRRGQFE
ncbi:hypothetical protein GCM10010109_85700 [Actinoplanes campanulatus]|nr:hypothetical protein GCM10010109_85700 [Actinoplanes campanulatus]